MAVPPQLSITLMFGLRLEPVYDDCDDLWLHQLDTAEQLLAGVLGVPLKWSSDGELGGAFLEYAPMPVPEVGVADVRIHPNHFYADRWAVPHRRDFPLVTSIGLVTANLLDAGRLTSAIYAHAGEVAVLTSYVVSPYSADVGTSDLWRAHGAEFMTDDAGVRRWTAERSPVGDDIRWSADAVAPVLIGHVVFAVRATDWNAALTATRRAFPVPFVPGADPDIGGDHHVHAARDGSSVLLRRNQITEYMWMFSDRKDVTFLLAVTMHTQSLLDLGRLTAALEASGDFEAIAYRAVGDLVHDRVPRLLAGRRTPR